MCVFYCLSSIDKFIWKKKLDIINHSYLRNKWDIDFIIVRIWSLHNEVGDRASVIT
jgi:hypothetical protein